MIALFIQINYDYNEEIRNLVLNVFDLAVEVGPGVPTDTTLGPAIPMVALEYRTTV